MIYKPIVSRQPVTFHVMVTNIHRSFGNHGNHGKSLPIVHAWHCLAAVRQCNKNTLSVDPDVIPSIEIWRFPVRRQYLYNLLPYIAYMDPMGMYIIYIYRLLSRKNLGLWDSMNSMSSWQPYWIRLSASGHPVARKNGACTLCGLLSRENGREPGGLRGGNGLPMGYLSPLVNPHVFPRKMGGPHFKTRPYSSLI